jgi:isopenicillin N synthase-like dioxygenase
MKKDFCYNIEQLLLSLIYSISCSETLEEFSTKVKSMMEYLLRCMARSLNLEEGSFLDQFGKQSLLSARTNFYPRCARPDLVLGVKPHTDRSGITTLLQDKEVEGLQILIDDKWINVPTIPDALVVNLGDQMQVGK